VLGSANPDDVRGKIVAGNLPLNLAALAAEVVAVEFSGSAPRGAEYGLTEMEAAGARLRRYRVIAVPDDDDDDDAHTCQMCGSSDIGTRVNGCWCWRCWDVYGP
jgi:hypothetical protein